MGDSAGSGGFSGGGVHMSMDDIFSQFGDILEDLVEVPLRVFLVEIIILQKELEVISE